MSKTDADSSFSSLIDDSSALIPERVTTTAVQEDDSDSEDELSVVSKLIEIGPDLTIVDNFGANVLHYAVSGCNV